MSLAGSERVWRVFIDFQLGLKWVLLFFLGTSPAELELCLFFQ